MGWGAIATLAEDIAPFGLASRVLPVDYQTIAEPVHRILDSLISGGLSDYIVNEAVEDISKKNKNEIKNLNNYFQYKKRLKKDNKCKLRFFVI